MSRKNIYRKLQQNRAFILWITLSVMIILFGISMYAMEAKLNRGEVNMVTLEDSVEYHVGGVDQVHINDKAGINLISPLRDVLCQNLDSIRMVKSEIADYKNCTSCSYDRSIGTFYLPYR